MDDAQRVATEIALSVLATDGFILAGGQALAEHGVIDRMSEDIDLFAQHRWHTPETFAAAVDKITYALVGAGYSVEITRQYEEFASLTVAKDDATVVIDLGLDWWRAAQWARDCFLPRRHSLARGSSTASVSSSQSSWSSGVYPEATASAVDLHSARTTNNLSKLEIAAQARATSTISAANCSRWLCGRKPSQGNGTRSFSAKLKAPGASEAATRLAAKRSASCSRSTAT